MRMADSSFDQYTLNPSSPTREWITTHMWRMGVYSPYFDSRTSWYRNGWVYDDAYAIYRGGEVARERLARRGQVGDCMGVQPCRDLGP